MWLTKTHSQLITADNRVEFDKEVNSSLNNGWNVKEVQCYFGSNGAERWSAIIEKQTWFWVFNPWL